MTASDSAGSSSRTSARSWPSGSSSQRPGFRRPRRCRPRAQGPCRGNAAGDCRRTWLGPSPKRSATSKSKGFADPTGGIARQLRPHTARSAPVRLRSDSGGLRISCAARSGPATLADGSGAGGPTDIATSPDSAKASIRPLPSRWRAYSAKIDESRDTFLAVLGHDLRGPLASLSNCVQVQGGGSRELQRRANACLHIAKRSIASMDEMITDLLEYTRTRLGRGLEVSPRPGNLDTLCGETVGRGPRRASPGALRVRRSRGRTGRRLRSRPDASSFDQPVEQRRAARRQPFSDCLGPRRRGGSRRVWRCATTVTRYRLKHSR